ncbi:endonuclease [Sediminibacillus dalangtanensis]|uniref:Endonuclease n=1 Tax=Sediminibacillus dalangtanensis TaxID=2729421 RepID=A0ABX7VV77_9BACI|nr:endonuclease/exonuclease/phosphatase family protein [Sediminibacillus dalangtanensis]QTN00785.1 endonuclease [Sediminibacillus dalangtanensis]
MKKFLLGFMASIVFLFASGLEVSAEFQGKQVSVDVMSYNIYHGVGLDGELNLERTADVIKEADAEIVGIQEVDRYYGDRSEFKDVAKELADLLGYHYVFAANLDLEPANGRSENRQYGTAILSEYPIIDSENIFLSSFDHEQRGLLRTKINVRGIHLNVYNTHLGLDVVSRLAQVGEIIEVALHHPGTSFLLGDLNAEPDSEEYQLLVDQTDFVDAFANVDNANTFPVLNPIKRIDYIFATPDIEVDNQRVIQTEASDHLPVAVEAVISR